MQQMQQVIQDDIKRQAWPSDEADVRCKGCKINFALNTPVLHAIAVDKIVIQESDCWVILDVALGEIDSNQLKCYHYLTR